MFHLRSLLFDWSPFARVPQLLGLLPQFIVSSLSALSRLQKCSSPVHAQQAGQGSTPVKHVSPFVSLYIWAAMISANVLYFSRSVIQCPLRQHVKCRNAGVMLHDIFLVLQRLSGSSLCRQSRSTHVNSEWPLCFSAPCSSLSIS